MGREHQKPLSARRPRAACHGGCADRPGHLRWARHAAYGGGFEEVHLAWGPEDYLDPRPSALQAPQAAGPGLTILRTASDGRDEHPNVAYGLAAFWVFGGGSGGAYAATVHDGYDGTPFVPEQGRGDEPAPAQLTLPPHRGVVYRRAAQASSTAST